MGCPESREVVPHAYDFRRCLVAVLSIPLLAAPAWSASVTGAFVEKGARNPLLGVEVVLRDAADSSVVAHASTGADGRFGLDSLRVGRYLLRASLLGYVTRTRSDVVLTDAAPTLDLGADELAISPIGIKGVEKSTARATAIVASDRNLYLTRDMPSASTGTATDLLRAVPELDVDIDDRVSLRGSSSVTIQINGRPSPLKGDALTAFLRQYPASRIERIEVISNPSAKFDPEGMAGIVNIVTKEALDLGTSGSVNLTLGDRNSGPGTRIARQKGKLTLHGGLTGFWNRREFRLHDQRQHLLAQPPNGYDMLSDSENHGDFGNFDASFDYAFDKRSTLYGTTSGFRSSFNSDARQDYVFSDDAQNVTMRYVRTTDNVYLYRSGTATLGFAHVVEKSRKEWTAELRHSRTPSHNTTDAIQVFDLPADSIGRISAYDAEDFPRETSLQVDDTHPLGKKGKLEVGYRGVERSSHNVSTLAILSGAPGGDDGEYRHREVFHTGYVTLGSTFGRLSLQGGVRAEAANTSLDVIPTATHYDNDYRSVFPSANVAWDFGKGRTTRLTYSKRIERPSPWILNPNVPNVDSMNRFVGNPYLSPKYTHSFSLEASWAGSRGLLRLSPYYRETIDNWDQFRSVDAQGNSVTTWLNASSIRFFGTSLTASLRQTGRLGGTLNLSIYREIHDASNLTQREQESATLWSLGGNATFKLTKALDAQTFLRYNPAQTLAQGRISGIFFSNVGARYKVRETLTASLTANDPFKLWKYELVSSDASYVQRTTNRGTINSVAMTLSWTWGKPPETKQRRQQEEGQPQDQSQPMR
jgi:outer membrane beta-barrel protein/carboxypeptidase family protein/TonB-dependent receptor-like protein